MKRFVFRAQVALELRRRQEEEARRALAAAEAREREASARLDQVLAELATMMHRALQADGEAGDVTPRIWYRNWIAGQQQSVEQHRQAVRARRAEVDGAAQRAQAARRKVKSLERLRERARRRHGVAERREEQKGFDELGTSRFALNKIEIGGDT